VQSTATNQPDPLAVHRAVMAAAGPEALAGITRNVFTPREQALLDLINESIGVGGVVLDEGKFAILADEPRRDAYLAEAETTR